MCDVDEEWEKEWKKSSKRNETFNWKQFVCHTLFFLHGNECGDGRVNFTTFALLCKCQRQAAFHREQISYRTQGTYTFVVCHKIC